MKNYFKHIGSLVKENIRDYGMYIALLVIFVTFTITTGGLFISPRNIANLFDATGYIAVLSVGMTLVIVIRHIDLSVGFIAGFLGAVAAILSSRFGLPVFVIFPIVLFMGGLIGLWNGWLVAKMGLPAFVATLAGMLIFKGALINITKSETIFTDSSIFNAIGNGFIPDIVNIEGVHVLTVIIGIIGIILFVLSEFKNRNKQIEYNLKVLPMDMFVSKLIFIAIIITSATFILATYKGISWTLFVVAVVIAIYHFITTQTVLGRHIYAVGGNPEAAELSGISVKFITFVVFGSMSMLAALSGILFTARLQAATPTAGTMFELDAIAGAFVGGVSAGGGVGKVTGSVIGALVMSSLTNGMNLMGTDASIQYIIRGAVLVAAVIFDVKTRNAKIKVKN